MPRVKLYRVAEPGQHAVFLEGELVVPDPAKPYRADDPMVVAFPWLFVSDEDRVEAMEARPGEKRRIGRPPLPRDKDGNIIRG